MHHLTKRAGVVRRRKPHTVASTALHRAEPCAFLVMIAYISLCGVHSDPRPRALPRTTTIQAFSAGNSHNLLALRSRGSLILVTDKR